MSCFIDKTAIVDDGSKIGDGCRIWHFSHVCSGATLGNNVSLGQNVFVGNDVVIGNNCKIQNNVSVYENVTLGDAVFCGPSVVFTNVYNPRAQINRKSEYKKTLINYGATLGANCTIVCGVTIGRFAFVGAGALVRESVPDYALVVGNPGKQIGWMSEFGSQLDLSIKGFGTAVCEGTGEVYELNKDTVSKVAK